MSVLLTDGSCGQIALDSFVVASSVYDVKDITDRKIRDVASQNEVFVASGCSQEREYQGIKIPAVFLDGGVVKIPLEQALKENGSLQENLFIGLQVIKHTQKIIPCLGNHMQRITALGLLDTSLKSSRASRKCVIEKRAHDGDDFYDSKRMKADETKHEVVINKICSDFVENRRRSIDPLTSEWDIETMTTFAKSSGIGNCYEMAYIGYEYMQEAFPDKRVELVQIINGDHVFLVIGREESKTSKTNSLAIFDVIFQIANRLFSKNITTAELDYKSWGSDVVVCDPWSGSCFPSSKIEQYLMAYCGRERPIGRVIPCVTSFDPKYHSLASL